MFLAKPGFGFTNYILIHIADNNTVGHIYKWNYILKTVLPFCHQTKIIMTATKNLTTN